ncbi:MAG: dephospho-CoA kinase [Pseudomonadota bacterium]
MIRVALTGGIASGKSSAAACFANHGIPSASSDRFARDVVAPGSEGLTAVTAAFGPSVLQLDGGLDRGALRTRIFADDTARERLEALLHPRIRAATEAWCVAQRAAGAGVVLIEIPLLVETAQHTRYDHVVVVDVDTATQVARVLQRDGGSEDEARQIIAKQASRGARLDAATDVLLNDQTLDTLRRDAGALAARFASLYPGSPSAPA